MRGEQRDARSAAAPPGLDIYITQRPDTHILVLSSETPAGFYVNLFTGEHIASVLHGDPNHAVPALQASDLFSHFPVALLRQGLVNADARPL